MPGALDDVDREIIDRLRANARMPATEIAAQVNLAPSAVRRRITRLEECGVIDRYTIGINHDKVGATIEAYVELSFRGNADVHEILRSAMERDEVREAMTIAGDLDALVRLRVRDLSELREAVMRLRASNQVSGSKTRIVLGRWWHGSRESDDAEGIKFMQAVEAVSVG